MRLANGRLHRVVASEGHHMSAVPMLPVSGRRTSSNEKGKMKWEMRRCRMPGQRVKGEASPAFRGP